MKLAWLTTIGWLSALSQHLLAYGPFGLFGIALLDSAFVPLPAGPDAVMMLLSLHQSVAWVSVVAAAGTLGSAMGCLALYYISRRAGKRALARFSETKQIRVKALIDRYDMLSVVVASILPPPFPFKLFVITAGVFRFSPLRFAIAITGGRALRFFIEGYATAVYGEAVKGMIADYSKWVAAAGIGLIMLLCLRLLRGAWRKRFDVEGQAVKPVDEVLPP